MKKFRLLGLVFATVSAILITMASCVEIPENIDTTLLPGKWQDDTLFEVYNEDGTGYTWDTKDDITEEEAQTFSWEIEEEYCLIQYHNMESSEAVVPKTYTIEVLSNTALEYSDSYGVTHSFERVVE